jgi:hypothetical protein
VSEFSLLCKSLEACENVGKSWNSVDLCFIATIPPFPSYQDEGVLTELC